jgi:hypothetical protein
LHLGLPVAEAQQRIDAREFAEWMAYDQLDPFGQVRGDLQAGIVASTLVNLQPGRRGAAAKVGDFVLRFFRRPSVTPVATEETLKSRVAAIQRALSRNKKR